MKTIVIAIALSAIVSCSTRPVSGVVIDRIYTPSSSSTGVGTVITSSGSVGTVVSSSGESEKYHLIVRYTEVVSIQVNLREYAEYTNGAMIRIDVSEPSGSLIK